MSFSPFFIANRRMKSASLVFRTRLTQKISIFQTFSKFKFAVTRNDHNIITYYINLTIKSTSKNDYTYKYKFFKVL